jgi:hypothetical protein
MKAQLLVLRSAVALSLAACGSGDGDVEEPPATPIAGMYEVTGETITPATGDKRSISGKIIIAEEAGRYTATFNLTTTYPGAEEALPAEVIGKGEGLVNDRSLTGTAQTQLVMATVPGIDPGFAFVPRMTSTRIVSKSTATVAANGSVQIQIESYPAEGESYTPTRTTLSGFRVSSTNVLEDAVAARQPETE